MDEALEIRTDIQGRPGSRQRVQGYVAEEHAGRLVPMTEGQSVTYKDYKKLEDMQPIDVLPELLRVTLST